jgi:hypothetical protein
MNRFRNKLLDKTTLEGLDADSWILVRDIAPNFLLVLGVDGYEFEPQDSHLHLVKTTIRS